MVSIPSAPGTVTGRVIARAITGSWQVITIAAGTNSGVQPGWTATILRGDTNEPLAGGAVEVLRVDKAMTVGKTSVTADQLSANPRIRLSPP